MRAKIFLALLLLATPSAAEETIPTLTATAEGHVMAEPDIVMVTLGVVTTASTARAALDSNTADGQRLIAALKAAGIADKDIATQNFSVDPIYAPPPRDQPDPDAQRVTGYRVTNQVRVRIEGVARSGDLLDRVVAAGANRIGSISFDFANPQPLRDRAVQAAIAEARRKAELMAEAAGVRLGRLISLSTGEQPVPMFAARPMAAKAVPIAAGERSVSASATLAYEIEPR
jgi:uncharacterized protein YggE